MSSESDGDSDHLRLNSRGALLVGCELLMCGGGRVNHKASRVADIREVREHLEGIDELLACFESALEAERENGAGTLREVLLCKSVIRARRHGRVPASDQRVIRQEFRGSQPDFWT